MRRKDREVTDIEKIKEILDACKVSRIGLMDQGKVYIVPMNHGYSLEEEAGTGEGKSAGGIRDGLRP